MNRSYYWTWYIHLQFFISCYLWKHCLVDGQLAICVYVCHFFSACFCITGILLCLYSSHIELRKLKFSVLNVCVLCFVQRPFPCKEGIALLALERVCHVLDSCLCTSSNVVNKVLQENNHIYDWHWICVFCCRFCPKKGPRRY